MMVNSKKNNKKVSLCRALLYYILSSLLTLSLFVVFYLMFTDYSDDLIFRVYSTLPSNIFGGSLYLFYLHGEFKTDSKWKVMPLVIVITWGYVLIDFLFLKIYTYSWIFNFSLGFVVFITLCRYECNSRKCKNIK